MLRRFLPFAILLAVVGAGGAWAWRRSEPGRRYAKLRALLQAHRDLPPSTWSRADDRALWRGLAAFPQPEWFAARVVDDLGSKDPDRQHDAAVLAAELRRWWRQQRNASCGTWEWLLPAPPLDRGLEPLAKLLDRELHRVSTSPLARHPSLDVRRAFSFLAAKDPAEQCRAGLEELAVREPDPALRWESIEALGGYAAAASTLQVLRGIATGEGAGLRLAATASLARLREARAARDLVAAFAAPPKEVDEDILARCAGMLRGSFPALSETIQATTAYWRPADTHDGRGLPPEVLAPWTAWLKSEGFAP